MLGYWRGEDLAERDLVSLRVSLQGLGPHSGAHVFCARTQGGSGPVWTAQMG